MVQSRSETRINPDFARRRPGRGIPVRFLFGDCDLDGQVSHRCSLCGLDFLLKDKKQLFEFYYQIYYQIYAVGILGAIYRAAGTVVPKSNY